METEHGSLSWGIITRKVVCDKYKTYTQTHKP